MVLDSEGRDYMTDEKIFIVKGRTISEPFRKYRIIIPINDLAIKEITKEEILTKEELDDFHKLSCKYDYHGELNGEDMYDFFEICKKIFPLLKKLSEVSK